VRAIVQAIAADTQPLQNMKVLARFPEAEREPWARSWMEASFQSTSTQTRAWMAYIHRDTERAFRICARHAQRDRKSVLPVRETRTWIAYIRREIERERAFV
jgi:hypothetical protein